MLIWQHSNTKQSNQAGVVSIITVVLLAMVLTLITTAFVRSTTSNLRQALDNQLSTRAFYAAETGINDATTILNSQITIPPEAMNSDNCNSFLDIIKANKPFPGNDDPNIINSTDNVKYTCVLVKNKIDNIILTDPSVSKGYMFRLKRVDGNQVNDLQIKWGNNGQSIPSGTATELLTKENWGVNGIALIRITLYYPSNFTRSSLINNQKTFFLRPVSSNGTNDLNFGTNPSTPQSIPLGVNCTAQSTCTLNVLNISKLPGIGSFVYIKVTPIYNSSNLTITAYDSTWKAVQLEDAQYSIDVTGRANDVYRRLEVRRSVTNSFSYPDSVVKAGDLCKQFVLYPEGITDTALYDISGCSFLEEDMADMADD